MTQVMPSSGKLHFMKLDFEELAPIFFSFLSTKHFSSNLVQTFKSSVDVVERAFASAPLWEDIPVKENMPILLGCSLTNHRYGWEGCAHAKDVCVCVCVHMCAYVCLSLQVHFALQHQCAELPETGRKNNFSPLILLKTPCAASELLLVWWASVLRDAPSVGASAQRVPSLWP